jgi:hypothetical protein
MSPVGWKRKGDGNLFRKKGSPFGLDGNLTREGVRRMKRRTRRDAREGEGPFWK